MPRTAFEQVIYDKAQERVTSTLNGLYKAAGLKWGVSDREEIGAMLDGAMEAVQDWIPLDAPSSEILAKNK